MAPRATRTRAVQDSTDTAPGPELATSRHQHLHHSTNNIYTHNSSSSLFLADDEGSLAGSADEADAHGELHQPYYVPNNAQLPASY